MSNAFAAIKSQMGEIPYYVMTMPAQDLIKLVHIPSKEEWEIISVEEKYQRQLKEDKRLSDLVEYLKKDKNRFFGSIIVASENWKKNKFIPIGVVAEDNPLIGLYEDESKKIGYYNFGNDKRLFVLDGQHRVRALELALKGTPDEGSNPELCNDLITVVLVEHKISISRKIFTKVNRNAKKTSSGETLITDDDDIIAKISRDVADKIIGARLVSLSNNLTENSLEFTTLSTIADSTFSMIEEAFSFKKADRKILPEAFLRKKYENEAFERWKFMLSNFSIWRDALKDRGEDHDYVRKDLRRAYLCMRPMPQHCIFKAFAFVSNLKQQEIKDEDAMQKLNSIPWETDAKLWDRLLYSGGKIQAKNKSLITDVLVYLLLGPEKYDKEYEDLDDLKDNYIAIFPAEEQANIELSQIDEYAKLKPNLIR